MSYKIDVVPKGLYDIVLKEKRQLHAKIAEIQHKYSIECNEHMKHKESISKHVETIEELKRENEKLKNVIQELNGKIEQQQKEINELKENDAKLNEKMNKMTNRKYVKNIIRACQDLNRLHSLERNLHDNAHILYDMMQNRNEFSYFIMDSDDFDCQQYKQTVIIDKLRNLTSEQNELFEIYTESCTLRNDIVEFCNDKIHPFDKTKISKRQKLHIDDWFDE